MSATKSEIKRRLILTFSVTINLGLLIYFKYSNFFIENINHMFSIFGMTGLHWTKLIMPIGISFYTFETVTYVVDVYRKVHKPLDKFWDYQLYIILFPKLIAGPIVRYHEIADQITDRSLNENIDNRLTGFYRFTIGLGKKVLIANQMGYYSDAIFAMNYSNINSLLAWMGIISYTFQIYFDFSGYSDMAIGIAKMIGFKIPENFNNPYCSKSITEFWRRWHITLGNWMRNYLYIPLGGNRVASKSRLYFNLWLVFLVSGFWHGASWNFIIWGVYHGFFLIMERIFLLKVYEKIGKLGSNVITFFIVLIGWIFFRVEKISDAIIYIKKLIPVHFWKTAFDAEIDIKFYTYLIIAIIFAFFTFGKFGQKIQNAIFFNNYTLKRHIVVSIMCFVLLILSISSITAFDFNPFIYFRF